MAVSETQAKALKKYAQSPKGKEALDRAYKKRASTVEYRAYQREKQKEYRQRRKLEAGGEQKVETPINTEVVVPIEKVLRLPTIKVVPEVDEILRSLPNRSEYIRDAVIRQLREDGLLKSFQDSTAVEAIKPHAQKN